MTDDPIVSEVREARRRIFEECGGNLDSMIERLREAESKSKGRCVTLEEVRSRTATGEAPTIEADLG